MKKKTLVLGASTKPTRYSNMAIKRLRNHQVDTVAFGLREGQVADVPIDTDLEAYEAIDTVTLYLNPQRQEAYQEYILGLRPRRVIFNPGTENPAFSKQLEAAGIEATEACTLVLLATDQY